MGKYIPVEPEKWAEMVKALSEVKRLQAENERLRKAGDELAKHIERTEEVAYDILPGGDGKINDWNAAKEGKQS